VAEADNLTSARDELGLLLDELRSFAANRGAVIHRKCIANLYYAAVTMCCSEQCRWK